MSSKHTEQLIAGLRNHDDRQMFEKAIKRYDVRLFPAVILYDDQLVYLQY